jgi:hypothetical protein
MHGREKPPSAVVNASQLFHVDFNLFGRAQKRAPGLFCLSHPGTLEPACEFQAAKRAILVNPDPQHDTFANGTPRAKSRPHLTFSKIGR